MAPLQMRTVQTTPHTASTQGHRLITALTELASIK
jgi:hypothetical protein